MNVNADLIVGMWLGFAAGTGFCALIAVTILWIGVRKEWW